MRTLIIGDSHITEKAIPELTKIFAEILNIKADKVIQLGDFYEKNRPTPAELKFGTRIAKELEDNYNDIVILSGTGNHDILNDTSVVEYMRELGIKISKGNYIFNNILLGHFMLHESKLQYGTGRCGIKDLKKWKYVFLGHQHNPQVLKKGQIYHPGSIRYCNWNEVEDKYKQVVLLENDKIKFIKLKSPIKMIDVDSISELSKIPKRTKVRVVYSSFEQVKKEINHIKKYKDKFHEFKIKYDFQEIKKIELGKTNKQRKLLDIIKEGIQKIEDKEVREMLKKQFEEGN